VAAPVVRSWAPARRVLSVAPSAPSYLVVNENFNAGWQARAGGKLLRAVRLDGWKQAWLLPAGTAGTVILTYPPDTLYRHAIFGGLGTLGLVMLVALWPGQPAWRPRWLVRPLRWLPGRRRAAAAEAAGSGAAEPEAGRGAAGSGAAEPEMGRRAAGDEAAEPEDAHPGGSAGPRARWRPGLAAGLTAAAAACCLALAGLWLGGYPGAAILPAATALFAVAVSYQRASPWWCQLSRPWVPAALLLAAAACGVVGGQLVLAGTTGPVVTALTDAAPQVICLAVVGRLAAALAAGDP
jgi:arabinofuranan 3-O-arabinosyltransferase